MQLDHDQLRQLLALLGDSDIQELKLEGDDFRLEVRRNSEWLQAMDLPKVIELLAARGLALSWARYVGDDPPRITADLRHAYASGDAVFSCGGIGATPDDHTRQCAAAALGVP